YNCIHLTPQVFTSKRRLGRQPTEGSSICRIRSSCCYDIRLSRGCCGRNEGRRSNGDSTIVPLLPDNLPYAIFQGSARAALAYGASNVVSHYTF
ncbi:MAG: hypothetical protein ABJL67_16880, partial [Sulfitobacter sp.]